jgi:putative endonuclease
MNNSVKGKKNWFVYLLECNDHTLYTGITNDLARRFGCHQAGKAARYTRGRLPVRLVYHERCIDQSSALKREHAIKQMDRREKLSLIGKSETA